jgi:aldehyde:ferredoxin oxidoreductase
MKGFYGKILRINLKEQTSKVELIEDEIYIKYYGGKGLATYLLIKDEIFNVEPMSDKNKIIFAIGSITDTPIHGSSRYGVFTKSPLTGIYSESYSGGDVGQYISRTGYDAIIIEDKSEAPVFLEISENQVVFHNANDIWGKGTYETEDIIRDRIGKDSGIITIGQAAENLVKFAVIENNYWRSAGRTGVGTVLGYKKVKAIAFKGNKKREVFSEEGVKEFTKKILERAKDDAGVKAYKELGTPMLVAINNSIKGFPSKYWHQGTFDRWEKISADAMKDILNPKPKACPKCFMACGKLSEVKDGKHKGLKIEGPEYETIYAFGGLCLIDDLREIAYLNDLCDNYGIDTITAGNLVAFTMEASELGKIDYKISYGDANKAAELIEMIVFRKGIGDILAEGIKFAAKKWDMEDIAIHVKGLEPAGYEPRVLKGMGLAYATSPRGACHLRATFYKAELSGLIDKDQVEGKAELFLDFEQRLTIHDCLIVCRFYRDLYMWDELGEIIYITSGMKLDKEGLIKLALNVLDLTKFFNNKCGLTKVDDSIPVRFFNEPINDGKDVLKRDDFEKMLKDYYKFHGWQ